MTKNSYYEDFPNLYSGIEGMLNTIPSDIARILDNALSGKELSISEGSRLFETEGTSLLALMATANLIRESRNGDNISYVVNRNINFTNVCIKRCGFCAFSRDFRQEEGYFLPLNEIIRRVQEAIDLGASEVCIQAGLPPKMEGSLYSDLTRAIKERFPDVHIHGFSPEEVLYGSIRDKSSIKEYLLKLQNAGIGSLPGTSAEILIQTIRDKIAPGRITVEQWTEVITTAHSLGIPTTSTIMFGHIETNEHRATHLSILRDIQKSTGGFTEFVPLSFVHEEAPMFAQKMDNDLRPGATGAEVIRMHAIARLMLDGWIDNIQCSWVKEGPKLSQILLEAGCNDLGGTLINESISTAAGASYGQLIPPSELRRLIRDIGRIPVERNTLYRPIHVYEEEPMYPEPLDFAAHSPEQFGSFVELVKLQEFRYEGQRSPSLVGPTLPEVLAKND